MRFNSAAHRYLSHLGALVCGALLPLILGAGLGLEDNRPIRASRMGIIDKLGIERIRMDLDEDGAPYIAFYDDRKVNRISLRESKDGSPNLVFFDSAGRARMGMLLNGVGAPEFALFDEEHRNLASVSIVEGWPILALFGRGGAGVGLKVAPQSSPQVIFSDENTVTRLRLMLDDTGKARLTFIAHDGREESQLTSGAAVPGGR